MVDVICLNVSFSRAVAEFMQAVCQIQKTCCSLETSWSIRLYKSFVAIAHATIALVARSLITFIKY